MKKLLNKTGLQNKKAVLNKTAFSE